MREADERQPDRESTAPLEARATGTGPSFDRRRFLKLAGFSFGGAALSGCTRGREEKLIPYLVKPEEITPGRTYSYASTCGACTAACGILTRNRDGRPIKLEGNPSQPVSLGGLCAVGQASVLGLYDSQRLTAPLAGGKESTWQEVDKSISEGLRSIRERSGSVRFLSQTIVSPSARTIVGEFLAGFPDVRWIEYDALSTSALLDAHEEIWGARVLPRFHFDRAAAIVSFDADFLGTWISPVEHAAAYHRGRSLAGKDSRVSHHLQIESRVSLTGSNADERIAVRPSELVHVLGHLAKEVARRAGVAPPWNDATSAIDAAPVEEIAKRLFDAPGGRALVVCGINDLQAQRLTAFINHTLGSVATGTSETTIDLARPSLQKRGSDGALRGLLDEIARGEVGALFIQGANPVYDLPDGESLAQAIGKIPLVVSFAERIDETARHAKFVCPEPHYLESWGDAEPVAGMIAVAQPAIRPLGNTRGLLASLSSWAGKPTKDYDVIRRVWQTKILPRAGSGKTFDELWNDAVHRGHTDVTPEPTGAREFRLPPFGAPPPVRGRSPDSDPELVLYPKVALLDGRHAHNAWLQELPDPVTKIAWDNYATLSPATAATLGVDTGDVVRVERTTAGGAPRTVELPVLQQPGQADGVVGLALGYGRRGTDRFRDVGPHWIEGKPTVDEGRLVGQNVAGFLTWEGSTLSYQAATTKLTPTSARKELACSQPYSSQSVPAELARWIPHGDDPRPLAQEATLAKYVEDPTAGSHATHHLDSMWPEDHPYTGHHWAMIVDLARCTGCSACVIGCQAENNVPVVGRDEVRRQRDMSWMRIDRYYSTDGDSLQTIHQPMMCQHCDNAPCENVCPVLATVHSEEGLNQQVYNRCVGTRYCANNCPYKVRRFNWFDYAHDDKLQNMVLNPDVTVRSRGVMEKCSFCVQRIQEAKAEAKREGRELADGDVQPACQQSCPTRAIVFGDGNDPESTVSNRQEDPRHYRVLEELNVLPSVGYLRNVRDSAERGGHHG